MMLCSTIYTLMFKFFLTFLKEFGSIIEIWFCKPLLKDTNPKSKFELKG